MMRNIYFLGLVVLLSCDRYEPEQFTSYSPINPSLFIVNDSIPEKCIAVNDSMSIEESEKQYEISCPEGLIEGSVFLSSKRRYDGNYPVRLTISESISKLWLDGTIQDLKQEIELLPGQRIQFQTSSIDAKKFLNSAKPVAEINSSAFKWEVFLWKLSDKPAVKRTRLVWTKDPSRTATFALQLNSDLDLAEVYFDKEDHGQDYQLYSNKLLVQKRDWYKDMKTVFFEFEELIPDTKYYFLVLTAHGVSQRYYFKTAPDHPNTRLSFVAGGDSRNHRTPREHGFQIVAKLKPDAVLFGGDFTDRSTSRQWQGWLDDWQSTITPEGRMTPLVATRGNHEPSNDVLTRLFGLPRSNYYSLNFGEDLLQVITLNSESSVSGNQAKWLKSELESATFSHRIVQYHKPMRPIVKRKSEGQRHYEAWSSLFYQHQVRLVMESDSHAVKITWPIRPSRKGDEGFVVDRERGTVFLGEGAWGAPLRAADDEKSWTRAKGSFNQFKWIFVDSEKMQARTVKITESKHIESLPENDRFRVPKGLQLWKPGSGELVTVAASSNTL